MDTSPPPDELGLDDFGDARVRDLLAALGAQNAPAAPSTPTGGALPDGIPDDVADRITASLRAEATARELAGRDLLASRPAPGPMPDDVAARIIAALGAEQQSRADTAGDTAGDTPPGGSVSPLRRPQEGVRRRWPAVLAAAAAVAAVGVVGTVAVRTVTGDRSIGDATARIHILGSGASYQPDRLGLQARTLLTVSGTTLPRSGTSSEPLATTSGIRSCLTGLGISDATAVSLDLATYAGAPAAIIVVTEAGTTTAYAVGRDCSAGRAHLLKGGVSVP